MKNIFLKYSREYDLILDPIPNKNGIKSIYEGKDSEITRVEVECAMPDAATLEHVFGWKDSEILNVITKRNLTAQLILKPRAYRRITCDTEETQGLLDCIKEILPKYKKGRIRAKTRNIKVQDYNLFDDYFSYPIDINIYHIENYTKIYYSVEELVEIFRENLIMAFRENQELLATVMGRS